MPTNLRLKRVRKPRKVTVEYSLDWCMTTKGRRIQVLSKLHPCGGLDPEEHCECGRMVKIKSSPKLDEYRCDCCKAVVRCGRWD